ncbi:sensor histidine kinase [Psychrobacter sp. I-STPA6b]|uniref:sensor histidine kinase n=1 Tax=Psychrobacter sp. I-STPA6b TaxID=2585718 RepID=UPI001D0CAD88|nr:ATP-binding protein [Psychrobacter sp. I-STPA6b]
MNRHSQKNFQYFIQQTAIIPTTILFISAVSLYIFGGLVDTYHQKKIEIKSFSQMLAESASIPDGAPVVAQQVTYLLEQDDALQSISFYSIEQSLNFNEQNDSDWQVVAGKDVISFHQPVISKALDFSLDAKPQSALSNRSLLGYINVTLDLSLLRKQWFIQHSIVLLSLLGCYAIWFAAMWWRLSKPLDRLEQLADEASELLGKNIETANRLLKDESQFIQLDRIHKAMFWLHRLYQQSQSRIQELEKQSHTQPSNEMLAFQQSNFQSMITHELKTSLNAIFGGLQLLDNHYASNEQKDAINIIKKGSTDLDFILGQIIQLNKIEKGQMKVDVSEIRPLQILSNLIQTYEKTAKDKGIELMGHIHHSDQGLKGDLQKVYSILDVLINNAIKFTKEGSVTVESYLEQMDEKICWRVDVTDTGVGIEEHNLKDIFLPFFQVDPSMSREFEGVGVGLGVAEKLAKLIKGELTVKSVYGEGSTFSLILPLLEWKQGYESRLLEGVKIAYIDTNRQSNFVKLMGRYGALVEDFIDYQLLIDYIFSTPVNALGISSNISIKDAKFLAIKIRKLEKEHRLLIVYYYDKISDTKMNELQAAGVDFCQPAQLPDDELASAIKGWL